MSYVGMLGCSKQHSRWLLTRLPRRLTSPVLLPALALLLCGCPAAPPGPPPAATAFTLSSPRDPIDILLGSEKTVEITVKWKTSQHEPIELSVAVDPAKQGVSTSAAESIKADASSTKVTVSVSETAMSGLYKLTATGKTTTHGSTSTTFEVKVPEKE